MKHMNHVVVGAFALLMAFGSPSFGALIISEEFDGPTYAFEFNNYQPTETTVAFSQDTSGVLSGANSAKVDITVSGTEWWAIQVRSVDLNLLASSTLSFSFDIKSSADLNFNVVVEGENDPQNFPVSLLAGETKHYSFTTAELVNQGIHKLIFGLGSSTAGAAEVWIDNVQVEGDPVPNMNIPLVEEFDSAPAGENFGRFAFKNFGGGANYTFSQDTGSVLSGTNSAYLDITHSGDSGNWWAIQLRMENLVIGANTIIAVSFDIKTTEDITFLSRLESLVGQDPEDEIVTVLAGETKTVKYETGMITNAATSTFMLAMGDSTAGAAEVWIDKVKLRKWAPLSDIGDIALAQLPGTNGLALTWDTDEGYDYALETKSNLPIGNWTTNMVVPGVGGSVTVTTAVGQARAFYRVTSE